MSSLILNYLKSKLVDLKSKQEKLQAQIEAVAPNDILAKEALEKQLFLLFEETEQVTQNIQTGENSNNSQLTQRKFDSLIDLLQSSEVIRNTIELAYQHTLRCWPSEVRQNLDDVRSIIAELNKIAQGSCDYSALDEFIANLFHDISDVVLIDNLTQWGQVYCQNMDWLSLYTKIQELQTKRLEKARPAILITIARNDEASTQAQDGETYYQLESWLIKDVETYQTNKTG